MQMKVASNRQFLNLDFDCWGLKKVLWSASAIYIQSFTYSYESFDLNQWILLKNLSAF